MMRHLTYGKKHDASFIPYDGPVSGSWLTGDEQRAWRAFLALHRELNARLNRQLQADSQLSLADYEVLVALSEHPEGRMRPFELARTLQWEQSRLSHHLARMERRRLIGREECSADGRGLFIGLTAHGREAIEAAAPAHAAKVRELLFDALSAEEVAALEAISRKAQTRMVQAADCCEALPD